MMLRKLLVVAGRKVNNKIMVIPQSMSTFTRFKANEGNSSGVQVSKSSNEDQNTALANDIFYNPSRYSPTSLLGFPSPFTSPFSTPLLDTLLGPSLFPSTCSMLPFKINACESDMMFHVEAELPGVQKSDVHVNINKDNILTIQALKKHSHDSKHDDKNIHWHHEEHSLGKIRRAFRLPENIKPDGVKVTLTIIITIH